MDDKCLKSSERIVITTFCLILLFFFTFSQIKAYYVAPLLSEFTTSSKKTTPFVSVTIEGAVSNPGTYSVPVGTPLKKIIKKSGLKNSARVKAIDQSRVVDAPLHLFIEELTEICVTLHLSSEDIFTITLPFGSRVCDLKAYVSTKIDIDSKAFKSRRTLKDGEEVFLFEQRG